MILVGLTGGVATGKSTVARMFQECGAVVIDADILARQVVEPGKPAWREIANRFGKRVLKDDRTLDRQALAAIVFKHPHKLKQLSAIIHPRVARRQARLTREIAKKDPNAVIIYDVPLLFEAGVDERVQKIIVVKADRAAQVARLQDRNHLSRAEALRRIRSQMPLTKKVLRADYVIDGALPLNLVRQDVGHLYQAIKQLV